MKNGSLIKYKNEIYVFLGNTGRGSNKMVKAIRPYETYKKNLSELTHTVELPFDQIKEVGTTYEKALSERNCMFSIAYCVFKECSKNAMVSFEKFIELLVKNVGHPDVSENWVKETTAMIRAIVGDMRSEHELNMAWVKNRPLVCMYGEDILEEDAKSQINKAYDYAISEMKKVIEGKDEDIKGFMRSSVVRRIYGDSHGVKENHELQRSGKKNTNRNESKRRSEAKANRKAKKAEQLPAASAIA